PATVHASASRSAGNDLAADAHLVIDEPGAPTTLSLRLMPRQGSRELAVDLASDVADFDRIPWLRHDVRGRLQVKGSGTFDLDTRTVDAGVPLRTERFAKPGTRVSVASLDASARGALPAPVVDARLHGEDVVFGDARLASVDASVTGALDGM